MINSKKTEHTSKSPLIFLVLLGVLVISTLVTASEYFLRPQIESSLGENNIYTIMKEPMIKK